MKKQKSSNQDKEDILFKIQQRKNLMDNAWFLAMIMLVIFLLNALVK